MEKTPKTFDSEKSISSHFNNSKSPIRGIISYKFNDNLIPNFGVIKANEKVFSKEV